MHSTKHSPFFFSLADFNRKQDPERSSKLVARTTVSGKENDLPYYNNQLHTPQHPDPYHGDTDMDLSLSGELPQTNYLESDAVVFLEKTQDIYHQITSSLDEYLQDEILNRVRLNNQGSYSEKSGGLQSDEDIFYSGTDITIDTDDLSVIPDKKSERTIPTPFTPPRNIRQPNFAMESSGKFSGFAFKEHVTPERRKITEKETGTSSLQVQYNENGSPYKAFMKNGDELVELMLSMKTDDLYTFVSSGSLRPRDVYNPLKRSELKPSFAEFTRFSGSVVVTKKEIAYWAKKRKSYTPKQGQSMGNCKATDLARKAGVKVTGQYHHTHVIRFGFTPIKGKPNDVQNLIVATAGANFQHLMLEDTAKALITQHGSVVISFDIPPDQEVFDPVFHLFGFVNYNIYEARQELLPAYRAGTIREEDVRGALLQSFTIDALNPNLPHTTDQKYIQAYAYASKLRAHGFTSVDSYKRTLNVEDNSSRVRKKLRFTDMGA